MKKKGFTLIELLAVIVILAIIALIATPLVLKYIEKSRKESKVDSAYSFVRNLETEIANYSIKNNGKKYNNAPKNGKFYELTDFEDDKAIDITEKGDKPNSIKVCLSSLGQVEKAMFEYGKYYVSYDGKKGSISDKDTYDSFSCSGNVAGGDDTFERVYDYGDEVTFNPGDGDKTWNVIGEDEDTVTLLLAENLGDTVEWYATDDNNYGPITALNYLNGLTTNWNNVDPIASYSYVNNSNGTSKPSGYQKIEISNGITTLTHKDGTITTLDETKKAKARLLTIEELLEIASKTNENLSEENLEGYIIKNLTAINVDLGIPATTADEVIEEFIKQTDLIWLKSESKHVKLYFMVVSIVRYGEIDTTYDIFLPEYLYKKVNEDEAPYGYWTLSAYADSYYGAWDVLYLGLSDNGDVYYDNILGVRPVITIPKSKI